MDIHVPFFVLILFQINLTSYLVFQPHAVPNNYHKKGSSDKGSVADKKCSKSEVQKEEKRKRVSHKEVEMRLEESPESVS